MSLREKDCPRCGERVIEIKMPGRDEPLVVGWHAKPNGNIIIKGNKATILRNSARAQALLEKLGHPEVDRYLLHVCRPKKKPKRKRKR